MKCIGLENLPKEGAVILAANHTSLWDAPVLVPCIPRKLRAMAKKELFEHKLLKPILVSSGAFPVNRDGNDIGAIKTALKTLKNGEAFLIFPTGTRVASGETADAKSGVALISSRSGAPVIPVAIRGGYRPFHQVKIYFGEPLTLKVQSGEKATGEELKGFADEIMEQIASLGA
ncbi:MAG: 1-acyl-sn-glycerol-3-phosphate acyltransferase [Clostridia bacterium]|nr:1-acyl-sn-glycerol-3-phosphate acyltransferase [Clostridia bacterium]